MATSVCSPSYEEEILPELEGELEDEVSLHEEEGEGEEEISPIRKIYPDAVMEHLGELAAESESEEEAAEHFLPLIGMAASKLLPVVAKAVAPAARKALPKIARTVTRVTPRLTKSVGNLARKLHRNPTTRPLLRAVPAIARRTVHRMARLGMVSGWVLLGFWRSLIGLRSRKHAIARLGPRRPALTVV